MLFSIHIQAKNLLAQQQHSNTRMATEFIILIHVLPKHTLLLPASNTNKQLVLTSISKVVFLCISAMLYLLAYYFEICE